MFGMLVGPRWPVSMVAVGCCCSIWWKMVG